jgi:hypothetical protein
MMSSTDTDTDANATAADLGAGIDRIEANPERQRAIDDRDVALECLRVTVGHLWERVAALEAENEQLREANR